MDEFKELKREGLSMRAISRLTGYDRKAIGRYLLAPAGRPVYGPRPAPPSKSKLEAFKPYLKERLKVGVWNAQVLFRELRERNFSGGYSTLTERPRPQRKDALAVEAAPTKEKRKRGRPRKGEEPPPPEPARLERQANMTLARMLDDLPRDCNVGTKKNSKGYKETRVVYKLHIGASDGQIPISCILTSAFCMIAGRQFHWPV